jgi:protein-tyrosine phosphatase
MEEQLVIQHILFTKVLENLYLGNIKSVDSNIDYIINISGDLYVSNKPKLDIMIKDRKNKDIRQYFEITNKMIDINIGENKKVLVHCYNSTSRSTSIIIAYLLYKKLYNLKEAIEYLEYIRKEHPIKPNIGFFKQLIEYEFEVYKSNSFSMEDYKRYSLKN